MVLDVVRGKGGPSGFKRKTCGLWLARIPFFEETDWPDLYRQATKRMLEKDELLIRDALKNRDPSVLEQELKSLEMTRNNFESLFDKELHEDMVRRGARKMTQKATLAAIFISLYRDHPLLAAPFELIQSLLGVDDGWTQWRQRHETMARRQIGSKMGTGGSSGGDYLAKSTHENRIFKDLWNLPSFLIPISSVPVLPDRLLSQMGLVWEVSMASEKRANSPC